LPSTQFFPSQANTAVIFLINYVKIKFLICDNLSKFSWNTVSCGLFYDPFKSLHQPIIKHSYVIF
jgi:hypothetical protein